MDHVEAQASKATERYLLGEMSDPERFAFEAHYFECSLCADDVKAGAALTRGIQAVAREDAVRPRPRVSPVEAGGSRWLGWLSPSSLIPACAAAALACVVGYQSLVVIPGSTGSRAMSPVVLRAAARGDEQTIEVGSGQPFSLVSLDVNAAEPGTPLIYEVVPEGGSPRIKEPATAPAPGIPLIITLPRNKLDRAGGWTLFLRTPSGTEVARYPFQLKLK